MFQQGDLLLLSTNKIPNGGKTVPAKRKVLAEGEATGHAHVVEDDVDLVEINGTLYIKAVAPFTVTHEEHKPITVPAGDYVVGRVKEYDHFAEEARQVRD